MLGQPNNKTILAPLDLTPLGEPKIPVVEEYAQALGASVLLLHVLPPKQIDPSTVLPTEATARTYLDTIATRLRGASVEVDTLLRSGPVAPTIISEAMIRNVDLIVLGANIRPVLPSAVLGSVADQVVRTAACPVLLVQPLRGAPRPHPLRSFQADAERAGGQLTQRPLGVRTIELARVVGSVGRYKELGSDFRPRRRRSGADWQRFETIKRLIDEGVPMPPIEVYKLGFGYYVLDGHHRVAVALANGQVEIEANVIEYVPAADEHATELFAARHAFEQATGLTDIGAARPQTYARLLQLIQTYQREQGLDELALAARRWDADVFRPMWQAVRARETSISPGERTADVIARELVAAGAAAPRSDTETHSRPPSAPDA
jgi:nucleotide-binding universal stress UspA family protein